jgi:cyclophilin family peptidyl-prolyl cis-trans isomerase
MSSLRRTGPILALAAAVLLLAAAGCGGGKEAATTTGTAGSESGSSAPALDSSKTYTVTLKTNQGTFAFDLDVKDSPNTTASFVSLVKKGFFDGLTFHRIVPDFVIQGGDPKGDGTGGPGYSTVDPPPGDAEYTKGVVAMAKTGAEAPGTAGSQFFVVTAADAGLPPEYALLGNVSSGMDVVDKIGMLGDPATELPTTKVVIEKATVSES